MEKWSHLKKSNVFFGQLNVSLKFQSHYFTSKSLCYLGNPREGRANAQGQYSLSLYLLSLAPFVYLPVLSPCIPFIASISTTFVSYQTVHLSNSSYSYLDYLFLVIWVPILSSSPFPSSFPASLFISHADLLSVCLSLHPHSPSSFFFVVLFIYSSSHTFTSPFKVPFLRKSRSHPFLCLEKPLWKFIAFSANSFSWIEWNSCNSSSLTATYSAVE